MAMTPDDIRSQRFSVRLLRGLSPEEVSAFLEDVAERYGKLQKWNVELNAQVESLENEIQALAREKETSAQIQALAAREKEMASTHLEMLRTATLREVEALLHDAQARAQTLIDAAKESEAATLREVEVLLHDAQARAQTLIDAAKESEAATLREAEAAKTSLIMAAKQEEAALRSEIDRLAQSRVQLVDEIRAALDTYQQWLATVDPRGRARGRRETLAMSNGDDESVIASDELKAG
jgi:DivIVA domain-containing protein